VLRVVTEDAPTTNAAVIPGVTVAADAPPAPLITIPAPAETPAPVAPAAPHPVAPVIDLGLTKQADPNAKKPNALRAVLYFVGALLIILLGVLAMNMGDDKTVIQPPPPADNTLQFEFEKIEASPENIFRFYLKLTPDGMLSLRMNDIIKNRSIQKEQRLTKSEIEQLVQQLNPGNFMKLDSVYDATSLIANHLTEHRVLLVIGNQARQVIVRNRREPADFKPIRERLETFGEFVFGVTNISRPPEELIKEATENLGVARTFYNERSLDLGNLWRAIQRFRDAEENLETVDQKPADIYPDILSGLDIAIRELDAQYEQFRFAADHAINTRNWPVARRNLESIKRLIPDEKDRRHQDANRQLIGMQNN